MRRGLEVFRASEPHHWTCVLRPDFRSWVPLQGVPGASSNHLPCSVGPSDFRSCAGQFPKASCLLVRVARPIDLPLSRRVLGFPSAERSRFGPEPLSRRPYSGPYRTARFDSTAQPTWFCRPCWPKSVIAVTDVCERADSSCVVPSRRSSWFRRLEGENVVAVATHSALEPRWFP